MKRIDEFCKKLHNISSSRGEHEVFADFCELATVALRQPFEQSPELEKRFLEILKPYPQQTATEFASMLGIVTAALTEKPRDFLGECFHALQLHNQYKGQFFTPYHISHFMAEITLNDIESHIEKHGYFGMREPACGARAMVIAAYEVLRSKNINPISSVWVIAQDIDYKCCCMAYIQMSLLAIPGVVIWGNSLAEGNREQWVTSGYYLYPWGERLMKNKVEDIPQINMEVKPPAGKYWQMEFELSQFQNDWLSFC